jgi:hypothetical protein
VSKNWIKQEHTLPVLRFNRCLTTKYSETTANLNANFDTDNQIDVPKPKCTATERTVHLYSGVVSVITRYYWIKLVLDLFKKFGTFNAFWLLVR